jgi:hypothetical protein
MHRNIHTPLRQSEEATIHSCAEASDGDGVLQGGVQKKKREPRGGQAAAALNDGEEKVRMAGIRYAHWF